MKQIFWFLRECFLWMRVLTGSLMWAMFLTHVSETIDTFAKADMNPFVLYAVVIGFVLSPMWETVVVIAEGVYNAWRMFQEWWRRA